MAIVIHVFQITYYLGVGKELLFRINTAQKSRQKVISQTENWNTSTP
jgi:hypothetical protein